MESRPAKNQTNLDQPAEGGSGGPLHGIRILDMTSVIMGPFATQTLGDMGAEIITIEPLQGGGNRTMGPGSHDELSGIALNLLRNKRSVAIDMKHPKGREVVLRIAEGCDAAITNLRPQPLKRLGLSYSDVRSVRPDIVYCQAQGFRTDGARANDPAYDDIIQAESGLADASRRTGSDPKLAPTILADKICGLSIVSAVTAALFYRERTGCGQRVEVPMLDVMTSFMLVEHGAGAVSVPRSGNVGWSRALSPTRGPQQTLDGWINILPYTTAAYDALFAAGGRHDLVGQERTMQQLAADAPFLYRELKVIVATRTTTEWLEFCDEHRIPVGKIGDLDELVESLPIEVHPKAGRYHIIPPPIWFTATPSRVRRPAPTLGQDGRTVLAEIGYSEKEVEALISAGVVGIPPSDAGPDARPT
jgi:crotonobetainyl-CoA:carnitine CoA-transferase CaiB-like acyl-CoA transferase